MGWGSQFPVSLASYKSWLDLCCRKRDWTFNNVVFIKSVEWVCRSGEFNLSVSFGLGQNNHMSTVQFKDRAKCFFSPQFFSCISLLYPPARQFIGLFSPLMGLRDRGILPRENLLDMCWSQASREAWPERKQVTVGEVEWARLTASWHTELSFLNPSSISFFPVSYHTLQFCFKNNRLPCSGSHMIN